MCGYFSQSEVCSQWIKQSGMDTLFTTYATPCRENTWSYRFLLFLRNRFFAFFCGVGLFCSVGVGEKETVVLEIEGVLLLRCAAALTKNAPCRCPSLPAVIVGGDLRLQEVVVGLVRRAFARRGGAV